MFRTLLIGPLLLLVLLHGLALTVIKVDFEAERTRLEAQFCENRDRPELGCHAHCFLRRSLAQAEDAAAGLQRRKAAALDDLFLLTALPALVGGSGTDAATPPGWRVPGSLAPEPGYEAGFRQPPEPAEPTKRVG